MPGSRRRKGDTSRRLTRMMAAQSMIKFSTNSTTKLRNFLEIVPIWLLLVCFPVYAAIETCLLTLCQGNHEANCDNGADLTLCLPGQLNFTGYIAHWKYVDTILNFTTRTPSNKIK